MPAFNIKKFLYPITPGHFFKEIWPEKFVVSHGDLDRLQGLRGEEAVLSLKKMTKTYKGKVTLWMSEKIVNKKLAQALNDKSVDADEAYDFYKKIGATLYFTFIENSFPELKKACLEIEGAFGLNRGSCRMELFASRGGSGTPLHFDHEINFNLQIRGEKTWTIAENKKILFPLSHYRPNIGSPRGEMKLYAPRRISEVIPKPSETFKTKPGSLLFLPPGYWHTTKAKTDSLALSIAFVPPTWLDLLIKTMRMRMVPDPNWRKRVVPRKQNYEKDKKEVADRIQKLTKILDDITVDDLLQSFNDQ